MAEFRQMFRFFFLLCCLISLSSSQVNFVNVHKQFERLKQKFYVQFHEAFETGRIREKYDRNLLWRFSQENPFVEQQVTISSSIEVTHHTTSFDVSRVATWSPILLNSRNYIFSTTDNGMNSLMEFDAIAGNTRSRWHSKADLPAEFIPRKSLSFKTYHQEIYVIVLYEKVGIMQSRLEHELIVYKLTTNGLQRIQQILSKGMIDVDLINDRGNVYMVSSVTKLFPGVMTAHDSRLFLYVWKHTQFDVVADYRSDIELNSVKLFSISSKLYIATTQRDHVGGSERGSSIIRYKNGENLKFVQFIKMRSSLKVEHFRVGGNNYLIFIGSDDAELKWWSGQRFLNYQTIKNTAMAKDVSVTMLPHGEVILCFLFEFKIIFFSQKFGHQFLETYKHNLPGSQITNVKLVAYQQRHFFALFSFRPSANHKRNEMSPIWKLNFEQNEKFEDHNPLAKCIVNLHNKMIARDDYLTKLSRKADSIWVKSRNQTIRAPVVVSGEVISRRRGVIKSLKIVELPSIKVRSPNLTNTLIHNKVTETFRDVQGIQNDLKSVVHKRRPHQIVEGRIKFSNDLHVGNGFIGNVRNRNIVMNGLPFDHLKTKVLTINGSQQISSTWTFDNDLIIDKLVVNRLNNLNTENILRLNTNRPQVITGNLVFSDLFMKNNVRLLPAGRINGIQLDEFALLKHPQTITGRKYLKNVHIADVKVNGLTNGIKFSNLFANAVKLHDTKPQVIRGRLMFQFPLTHIDNFHAPVINGRVNIETLKRFGVSKSREQDINSPTFFKPLVVRNLIVKGLFNGLTLPRDLLTTNTPQQLFGNYVFNRGVVFQNNLNTALLNGLNFRTEAVRRFSPRMQIIPAHKWFDDRLVVNKQVNMDKGSLINNIAPRDLPHFIYNEKDNVIGNRVIFNELVIGGNVVALRGINNFLLHDLPRRLWSKTKNQVIPVEVRFMGPVNAARVYTNHVNGLAFPSSFITINSQRPQIIIANKIFTKVTIKEDFRTVHLNGLRLHHLARSMVPNVVPKDGTHEVIRGEKYFKRLEVKGNVIVGRHVNNINLERDVMLTNREQKVNSYIRFTGPQTMETLLVDGNIRVEHTLNGLKLAHWAKDVVLPSSSDRRIIRNKHFRNTVAIDLLSANGKISGVNYEYLRRNAVKLDTAEKINVPITITGDVHFTNLRTKHVNNMNFEALKRKIVLRHSDSEIGGVKTIFGNLIVIGNITTLGYANEFNLTKLYDESAMKSKNNVFHSHVTFATNVLMHRLNVAPRSRIDGVRLDNLVFLHRDNEIHGKVIMNGNVRVAGDIDVKSGVISGCNINELVRSVVWLNGTQVIDGRKTLRVLSVRGNVFTNDKKVNGMHFERLMQRLVNIKSNDELLLAPVEFSDSVFVKNLVLRSTANGVDIGSIINDAVLKSKTQVITGYKVLNKHVTVNGPLIIKSSVEANGLVNGVHISRLNESVVHKHLNQEINGVKIFEPSSSLVFTNDIQVHSVNDLKIPQDLVRASGDNVPGTTLFNSTLIIRGNLTVVGLLDQKNMTQWMRTRLSLSQDQKFPAHLIFKEVVQIRNLFVRTRINDVSTRKMLSTARNYVLKGYSFVGNVVSHTGIRLGNNVINDMNMTELMRNRVDLKRPQFIPGTTVFEGKMTVGHEGMRLIGGLNGIQVKDFVSLFNTTSPLIIGTLANLDKEISKQANTVRIQMDSVLHQSPNLEYFELFEEFESFDDNHVIKLYKVLISNKQHWPNDYYHPIAEALYFWRMKRSPKAIPPSTLVFKITKDGKFQEARPYKRHSLIFPPVVVGNTSTAFYSYNNSISTMREVPDGDSMMLTFNTGEDRPIYPGVLTDSKYFNIGLQKFAVVTFVNSKIVRTNAMLYAFDVRYDKWIPRQNITVYGAMSLDVVTMSFGRSGVQETFMSIANSFTEIGTPFNSPVYKWNPLRQQFDLFTSIDTWGAREVLFIPVRDELYLIFANEKATLYGGTCDAEKSTLLANEVHNSFYTQPISVYKFTGTSFAHVQSINVWGVNCLERFYLLSDVYLLLGSRLFGETRIYKYRGVNRFEEVHRVSTPGVTSVKSYWSQDGDLFVAIASDVLGQSKVLKAVITGVSPKMLQSFKDINL